MLSSEEKRELIENFPTIKFSYEYNSHKTISSDLYIVIPKGKKYIVWFTNYNRKNMCLLLELGYQKKIVNIWEKYVSFDESLTYGINGTICYGTLFNAIGPKSELLNKHQFFSIENIYYYKGENLDYNSFSKKLDILKFIFEYKLSQDSFLSNGVVFGLPLILHSFKDAFNIIKNNDLPYNVYSIQYRNLHDTSGDFEYTKIDDINTNSLKCNNESTIIDKNSISTSNINKLKNNNTCENNNTYENNNIYGNNYTYRNNNPYGNNNNNNTYGNGNICNKVNNSVFIRNFIVTPDIQNDIYYLKEDSWYNKYNPNNEKLIAHIPDYKTSVMMNKAFRTIKENVNLDFLEESDDDEEFENINLDKFVDLSKTMKMKCIFNYKFKRWQPIEFIYM